MQEDVTSINIRDYCLALKVDSDYVAKVYLSPAKMGVGKVLWKHPSDLQDSWGWDMDNEKFTQLKEAVYEAEGSYSLIDDYGSNAIRNPRVTGEALSGRVKSKSKDIWYPVDIKRPFIDSNREPEIIDTSCSCGDVVYATEKGGDIETKIICVHAAALMDYYSNNKDEVSDLEEWYVKGQPKELFMPFTFMSGYRGKDKPGYVDKIVIAQRYLEGKPYREINKDLLQNPDIYTEMLKKYIKDGTVGFEILQQSCKEEDMDAGTEAARKEALKLIDNRLKMDGKFKRNGKSLVGGLPADRYERDGVVVEVIRSEEYPLGIAVKQGFGPYVNLFKEEGKIDPIKMLNKTIESIDDRTKRKTNITFYRPDKIGLPGGNLTISIPQNIIEEWEEAVR